MRAVLCLGLTLAGCGRIGFSAERRGDAGAPDGDGTVDAPLDAPGCTDGDGLCPPGCLGMDTDCVAVCGDGVCTASAHESCVSCGSDCNTQAVVCGNGICDAGETSANCLADCGPTPWPSGQLEMDLFTAMNTARTTGVACGSAALATAPAMTLDPQDPAVARELAWSIAHEGLGDTTSCNGTNYESIINPIGYSHAVYGQGYQTAQEVVDSYAAATDGSCEIMMDATRTQTLIGVADDSFQTGWVFLIR